jgi:N-acetyl-anhydromuramyl-L-alanine amidase AmpD
MVHYFSLNTFKKLLFFTFVFVAFFELTAANPVIIDKKVNFGWRKSSTRKINSVIIHSTFNNSGGEFYDIELIIKQFSNYKVSSHYLIGRNGDIYRLVNEENIAFHAGISRLPDGTSNINEHSIGIELVTSFTEAPTEIQIKSLIELVNDIKNRHNIKFILRHSDIAPDRKTDPWNFDWETFLLMLKNSENDNKCSE